ncbi:conserved hypothetical protein [Streptomyces sviceus ATCC 29083]|uniref:Uncharacterized protein n=1 Tax=Streptomyces sviceus (strain ATCC 29083 / DSM 924 / JCM 4929 / NBRC 13980 / NCIMB 11184 / NRRL 5439 / UC 5370) TaxID=463191 RepID=B5HRN0_STRX2|nr:conserved hypothetical protein [Streptomyces sviceus ATCC 29083]
MAIGLTQADFQCLVRVIEHARERLEDAEDSTPETVRNASGAELLSLLYPRVGTAVAHDCDVAMLASEIRYLEAAVVNLESYGGHQSVLCEGYTLLERIDSLRSDERQAQLIDGILTLPRSAPRAPCDW